MSKQTAVEYLEQIIKHCEKYHRNVEQRYIEQAKEMEKVQVMQSLNDGKAMVLDNIENKSLEQYYNETFKSE